MIDDGQKLDQLIRRKRRRLARANSLRIVVSRIVNLVLTIGGFFV